VVAADRQDVDRAEVERELLHPLQDQPARGVLLIPAVPGELPRLVRVDLALTLEADPR
jgi:hypothetical protein